MRAVARGVVCSLVALSLDLRASSDVAGEARARSFKAPAGPPPSAFRRSVLVMPHHGHARFTLGVVLRVELLARALLSLLR